MGKGLRQFVRRILLIHVALLALLLAAVSVAAWHLYGSARDQAIGQSKARQALLAAQTSHGIEGFYDSILSDLNLLKPDEDEASDLPEVPADADTRPLQNNTFVRQAVSILLVHQLQGRAHLFRVDDQFRPHPLIDDRPRQRVGAARLSAPRPRPATNPATPFEQQIVAQYGPWLKTLRNPAISDLRLIDGRGIKLVCVPLVSSQRVAGGSRPTFRLRRQLLVAAVSARPIERNFLTDLGQNVSGFLIDESKTIVSASTHSLVGTHLTGDADPQLWRALQTIAGSDRAGSQLLYQPFHIGPQSFKPVMLSSNPVEVMGQHWSVLVASPLARVDDVVREFARKAFWWAAIVALSIAAILISTATQLIRSRLKFEHERSELLQGELRQARQIQLAWLPQKTKATCSSAIDIASLNRPASHISGDFYNFFELPDGRTALVIGDVTGHGTAAAFLMATTQLLVRNTLPTAGDPGRCLIEVNRQLTNQVFNGQFVTMQVLVIDPTNGHVEIATAGHPPPLIGDEQSFRPLKIEPQLVLGVDARAVYMTERFRIRPGWCILLYTDGAVETENPAGQRLRLDGLRRALVSPIQNAEALLQQAISAVNTFRQGKDLADDLTLLAMQLQPQPAAHVPELAEAARG